MERARGLACVADNVVLFSDRLAMIVQDVAGGTTKQLEYCKSAKVMYQSKPISRNLLVGALAISKNLTSRSPKTPDGQPHQAVPHDEPCQG